MKKKLKASDVINYLKKNNIKKKIDLNKSLLEENILDSYGIIELISFLEKKTKKSIDLSNINKKNFGSINKMVKYFNSQ